MSDELAFGHRLDEPLFPFRDLQALGQPGDVGLRLRQFLLTLALAGLHDRQLVVEVSSLRLEQLLLVGADSRCDLGDILGAIVLGVVGPTLFELQARYLRAQRPCLGFELAKRGAAGRIVEPQDQVAAADDLPELHGDLAHDAGLARLDDLRLRDGNDLAFATCDFVYLGNRRPGNETADQQADDKQSGARGKRRFLSHAAPSRHLRTGIVSSSCRERGS
ncbi:hypothetical protein D9M72_429870 [compost metagenome]